MNSQLKILIAVDSFKGSLSSKEISNIISDEIINNFENVEVTSLSVADGGEGTSEAIVESNGGTIVKAQAHDPLMREITSQYGILDDNITAIIDVASASGLTLLSEVERNPLITTTFGTGELILDAIGRGCKNIYLGLGGSATNDVGVGIATALGMNFLDENGLVINHGNKGLADIKSIDLSQSKVPSDITFKIICDVKNTLLGKNGATYTYSEQKGADSEMMNLMENNIKNFADIVESKSERKSRNNEGAGAAGGIGFIMSSLFSAELVPGIDFLNKALDLGNKIINSDIIITGEGKLDDQSLNDKLPIGISKLSKKHNKKVIALVGINKLDSKIGSKYFNKTFSLVNDLNITIKDSISNTDFYLRKLCKEYLIKELNVK